MVTRLMLSNGEFVYPEYMGAEERVELRTKMEKQNLSVFCSCRGGEQRLLYGISTDNRFFPLHKGYEHAAWCSRAERRQKTGDVAYDGNGHATVRLSFNPFLPADTEPCKMDGTFGKGEAAAGKALQTEVMKEAPRRGMDLRQMVCRVNRETYSERVMLGKYPVLSEDYFRSAVLSHCRKVTARGMDKSIRELSLKEDGCAFAYGRMSACECAALSILGSEGNSYRRFVPEAVLTAAKEDFKRLYSVTVEECIGRGLPVYVSGFVYQRVSRAGKPYSCFGRLCIFLVTKQGIYAGSVAEKETLECLMGYARRHGGLFLFPDTEEGGYFGIFRFPEEGKEGKVCFGKVPEGEHGEVLCIRDVPKPQEVEAFAWRILHG